MKIAEHMIVYELLFLTRKHLADPRFRCRLFAELYKNHFVRVLDEGCDSWEYIGSHTPAQALGTVSESLPDFEDLQDPEEWLRIESR